MTTARQWSPVVIFDAGKCHNIPTGAKLLLAQVENEETALQIAKNACVSMPNAIGCAIQPFLGEVTT